MINRAQAPAAVGPNESASMGSPLRQAIAASAHEREPFVRLQLIEKLFRTSPSVIVVSATAATAIGGTAAIRADDAAMIALVAVICLATLSLLPLVLAFPRAHPLDLAQAIRWERWLAVPLVSLAAGAGLLCARSIAISEDPFLHILTIALALGAIVTMLRNYFRPKLVLSQLAVLLIPPAMAMVAHDDLFYRLLAAGTVGLGFNVVGIALSLYADAVALLLSRGQLAQQGARLDAALDNMSHGLCMFDPDQTMVLCNAQYLEMYGFDPQIVKPGIALQEVIEYSCRIGNHRPEDKQSIYQYLVHPTEPEFQDTFDHSLADGRVILVSYKALPTGGWVAVHADITKQRAFEAQIEYMAKHDLVTGLSNRLLINEALEKAFARRSAIARAAVLLIDLDRFKDVNDTLGHPVGDEILREVADRLKSLVMPRDILARLGGDEFAIVRTGSRARPDEVAKLAEAILQGLREPFDLEQHRFVLGASIGAAFRSPHTQSPSALLRQADLALYAAKNNGRGQWRAFAAEMDRNVQERRILESGLRQALGNGEFELLYQPIVDVASGEVICLEALLRWHTADRGTLSPDEFIPLAEDVGVIRSIGEWALLEACREAATWPEHLRVAVNLSPVQFRSAGFAPSVMMALARSGLAPERLELEITESVLLKGTEATLATLDQLRALGVRIALDDFGTGYSSLSYLRLFKFDKVKIDKSFVHEMDHSLEARAVIEAVITLARRLNIDSTAEGVETKGQMEELRRKGCTQLQGFLFGRPAPAATLLQAKRAA